MEQITHHVEGQFNGQEATSTHAWLAANTQFRNDGRGRPLATSSANAYTAASNTRASISTSTTQCVEGQRCETLGWDRIRLGATYFSLFVVQTLGPTIR